ncbi:DUF4244 domain-containing protein [Streptomyces sp. NPDC046805]|uniref:DUF4244 domain-containing protein n=1 Tax=Streptomyces sp. NPDC046805 TaxID=3155134 RepID=UPI0033FC1159
MSEQARKVKRIKQAKKVWARVLGLRGSDRGMVTSEYAMGIVAAVGFALLLYEVVTSGQVRTELQDIVKRALSARM